MDAALPFDPMELEEDLPILRLVTVGLFMALILLAPAAVEAGQRVCLAAWMDYAANRIARCRVDETPWEPCARFSSDDGSNSWYDEESATRGDYG